LTRRPALGNVRERMSEDTATEDDPLVGRKIAGKYHVVGILGRGGFGAVYRAVQEPIGRPVALKVMLPQQDAQAGLRSRFFREARIVAGLTDPATVTLYDYGEEPDGRLYMAFELIEGVTLKQVLVGGPLEPRRVLRLLLQALGALAEAHRSGCVHRDIKPANLMLTRSVHREEALKVLDFGIAKMPAQTAEEPTLETREGVILGTPKYMSPEQARGVEVDHRTDLYALGCVAWAALTGRAPFEGTSAMDVLMAQVSAPLPVVDPALGVPPAFEAIIRRALAKAPEDRWPTAEAMARALADLPLAGMTAQQMPVFSPLAASAMSSSATSSSSTLTTDLALDQTQTGLVSSSGTSRQFAASLETAPVGASAAAPTSVATAAPPDTQRSRWLFAAGIALVVGVGGWLALRPAPEPAETTGVARTAPSSVPASVASTVAPPDAGALVSAPPAVPSSAAPGSAAPSVEAPRFERFTPRKPVGPGSKAPTKLDVPEF